MQTMAEWNIGLAVVTEPYFIPIRNDWHGSVDGSVAIILMYGPNAPPFTVVGGGDGYAIVKWGN